MFFPEYMTIRATNDDEDDALIFVKAKWKTPKWTKQKEKKDSMECNKNRKLSS